MSKKLNLGCGDDYREGWINVDLYAERMDVKHNLNNLPLPFDDDSVDKILISNTLENLTLNKFDFLKDCMRILKNDGILMLRMPSVSIACQHTSGVHPISYLNILKGTYDGSKKYHPKLGNIQSIEDNFSFPLLCRRLYELIRALGSKSIVWKVKKSVEGDDDKNE